MARDAERPPLAVTMGEPAGIGGEIALAAWRARNAKAVPQFFLFDDPIRLRALIKQLDWQIEIREIAAPDEVHAVFPDAVPVLPIDLPAPVTPGRIDPANSAKVVESIREAVAIVQAGEARALVTNPIQKSTLYDAGFSHPGHTEFLATLAGATQAPVMMLACPELRVVPVTVHLPLRDAVAALRREDIIHCATVTAEALTRDFGIAPPRLSVAGLNPHAGENGSLGREEKDIIAPAVEALKSRGLAIDGPHPADTMFHPRARAGFDAAICMYHDQALIPLKTIDFDRGVNITLGLPFVRTSPDHGTALAIAGKGIANPASMIEALTAADRMSVRRAARASATAGG
ncbi:MAG: 4-hydroxythreonine-4-phosphate dehydrogenase PdxA [Inquilinus sp.]|nr:4-hydroxythreonine-4-phosphate dehydrogenase PdxA [Inquilinus sp.]